MQFTHEYRQLLINEVVERFKCYWHVMHPVTFDPHKLYQLAYTKEEWNAMMLLKERRSEIINDGYRWCYNINSPKIRLAFETYNDLPDVDLGEDEIPEALAGRLRAWAIEAKRYDDLDTLLRNKLRELVQLKYEGRDHEGRMIRKAPVNTPGTLHRVWPELLPFLHIEYRDVMRNKKMKSPLPRDWTASTLAEFHYGREMAMLDDALNAMALLPDKCDKKYPNVSSFTQLCK